MTDLHIRVHGYSLVQVEAAMPWCYTIGLQESFGHSELVACGLEMSFEVELIRTVAGMVTTGGVDYVRLAELEIGLAPVHRSHLTSDMFGSWANYYERYPDPGTFLQVCPPPSCLCDRHRLLVKRLDRPAPTRRTR